MLTPGGFGQVRQALCGDCQPARGLFLGWKDGLTFFKQYPSQGLLILAPAADHVNPDLSDWAACPGAANPAACRGGGDAWLPELTSPARKGLCTKVRTTGQCPGEEAACPLACPYDYFKEHTCDVQEEKVWGWETRTLHKPGVSWGLGPLVYQGTSLSWNKMNFCISFGGKCQKYSESTEGQAGLDGEAGLATLCQGPWDRRQGAETVGARVCARAPLSTRWNCLQIKNSFSSSSLLNFTASSSPGLIISARLSWELSM